MRLKYSLFVTLLVIFMFGLFSTKCFAQQYVKEQKLTRIVLIDGSEFIGTIIKEDEFTVVFKTTDGIIMNIPKEKVKLIEQLDFGGRRYRRVDPNQTRLFIAPTARTLKGGQAYLSVYEIFFPVVGVGITNFLLFEGGISLFPFAKEQLYYVNLKLTPIQVDKFSISVGGAHLGVTGGDIGFGMFYSGISFGSSESSLGIGVGFPYLGRIWDFKLEFSSEPVFVIGGGIQVSNSVKLVSENWILTFEFPQSVFPIFGIRFFGEKLAADLGFIYISRVEGFPFFPWLGFTYNFGK
jgi:hypothetical protein